MPTTLPTEAPTAHRTKAQMVVNILRRRETTKNPDYRRAFAPHGTPSIVVGRPYADPTNKWKGYQQVKVDLTPGGGISSHLEEFAEQLELQLSYL